MKFIIIWTFLIATSIASASTCEEYANVYYSKIGIVESLNEEVKQGLWAITNNPSRRDCKKIPGFNDKINLAYQELKQIVHAIKKINETNLCGEYNPSLDEAIDRTNRSIGDTNQYKRDLAFANSQGKCGHDL